MRLAWAALCAVLLFASPARSQPKPAIPPSDYVEAAKAHFAAGSAYYDQANYNDAVKEFNEAYRLSQRTDLLYNIAICYERLSDWDNAIATLQKYLAEKPNATDRVTIETRIQNLTRRRDESRPQPVVAPVQPVLVTPTPLAPPMGERKRGWWLAGTITAAAGLVIAGTGLALAIEADQIYGQLQKQCMGNLCDPSLRNKVNLGWDYGISADVLFGIGGAAVAAGAILLIVQSRRPASAAHAQVHPTASGFAVAF